jgi:very-short-patch-repair endonuclease
VTDVEKRLWLHLQGGRIEGVSFRRQHPVGEYIADFCAPSLKLIVELDGGHHAMHEAKAKDSIRTLYLQALGFQVLRFWNNDIAEISRASFRKSWAS